MAAGKAKATGAADTFAAARENPYVQRIIDDAEFRDNVRVAVDAARDAYSRLNNGKSAQKVIFDDKKFHRDVNKAAGAARQAGWALREGPKSQHSGGIGRLLMIAVVGTVVALVASEGLRNKALDALFGAEEEFEYSSTTTPAPAPAAAEPGA